MNTGTVKFFNVSKGYGFIKNNDNGQEVFVHANGLIDKISQDDQVTFDIQDGRRGPSAINVRRA